MHFKSLAVISFFALYAVATPVSEPEPEPTSTDAPLLPPVEHNDTMSIAAARYCRMISSRTQGCDYDPVNGQRKYSVLPGTNLYISCKRRGRDVVSGGTHNNVWDYAADYGCWISARWMEEGCERYLNWC